VRRYLLMDISQLRASETACSLKPHRVKPKLCHLFIPLDMDMGRLNAIASVE